MNDHIPDATKMMTVQQWIESTHREGDQSLIGVSPDALARLLAELDAVQKVANIAGAMVEVMGKEHDELRKDKARLDWMLSKVDVYSRESGWNLITKIRFHPAYDTLISIRNRKDIDEEMKLDQ
jgi:hypothetical protein